MVAKTFSFEQADAAFAELAADKIVGKVILVKE